MFSVVEHLHNQVEEEPGRVYASYALSADLSAGFRDVTVKEMVESIDAFAWWLDDGWGRSGSFETIGYIGPPDLRYAIFFYAAIKCGYKTLFLSPLNSLEASKSILEKTSCSKIFHAAKFTDFVQKLQKAAASSKVEATEVVPLDDFLSSKSEPYPYTRKYEESKWDPVVVIHTSGTTGLPKPITMNFGFFGRFDEVLPPVPGRAAPWMHVFRRKTFLGPFPPFHLGGVYNMMIYPATLRATIVVPPADRLVSGELALEMLRRKPDIDAFYATTLVIEQTMRVAGGAEKMKDLSFVGFAGAPMAPWCGDELRKNTVIQTFYGSTETGAIPCLLPDDPADWPYIEFHPCVGAAMEPSGADNTYELVLPAAAASAAAARFRGNAWLFPDVEGAAWRSRDLFLPHPDPRKFGLWRFYGRVDDVLVLASGERFVPTQLEALVSAHPRVAHVMVVGMGRPCTAVLLEPKERVEGQAEVAAFVDDVWPVIEAANEKVKACGRVARDKVAVVEPSSLVRAPKGTIIRRTSGEGHREVIERLYRSR